MWTVPSLRARECGDREKDVLNLLFLAMPLLNVALPFVWKSPAFIFTADCVLMAVRSLLAHPRLAPVFGPALALLQWVGQGLIPVPLPATPDPTACCPGACRASTLGRACSPGVAALAAVGMAAPKMPETLSMPAPAAWLAGMQEVASALQPYRPTAVASRAMRYAAFNFTAHTLATTE